MPEIRKKYDREFRDGAVRIVEETNKPIAQVARDLGVNQGSCKVVTALPDLLLQVRSGCGECVEDVGWGVAEVAGGRGGAGAAAEPDDVDRGVTGGGHDLRAVARADAGV